MTQLCYGTRYLIIRLPSERRPLPQGRRKESRARGADRSKRAPTTLGQQIYPRNGRHPRHFLGNIMGYASHSHINDCFSNQILLAFSLYDLHCIILTIRKQIIAFKKGTFAPPAPPTEKQEGRLLPPAPLLRCACPPLFANNNYLVLFYVSHVIVSFFFLLICFLSFICICNGSQLRDGSRVRNSTLKISQAKPSYYYFLLLCFCLTPNLELTSG